MYIVYSVYTDITDITVIRSVFLYKKAHSNVFHDMYGLQR